MAKNTEMSTMSAKIDDELRRHFQELEKPPVVGGEENIPSTGNVILALER